MKSNYHNHILESILSNKSRTTSTKGIPELESNLEYKFWSLWYQKSTQKPNKPAIICCLFQGMLWSINGFSIACSIQALINGTMKLKSGKTRSVKRKLVYTLFLLMASDSRNFGVINGLVVVDLLRASLLNFQWDPLAYILPMVNSTTATDQFKYLFFMNLQIWPQLCYVVWESKDLRHNECHVARPMYLWIICQPVFISWSWKGPLCSPMNEAHELQFNP